MYELRAEKDGWSISFLQDRGLELPEWYLNKPDYTPLVSFYMEAFANLHTCRPMGSSMPNIPWSHVSDYCRSRGLDKKASFIFEYIIKDMDKAYLDWYNKQKG